MSKPADLDDVLARGDYARKQIFSKDKLVAWSHSTRFKMARRLVAPHAGKRLMDYGCGDGTFLAQVSDLFPDAVGFDVNPKYVQENAGRLGDLADLSFVGPTDLEGGRYDGHFDVLTCMEVLEHCVADEVERLLDLFRRLLKPDGTVVLSVPIEIGPTLLGKQVARTVAGWRNIGHYRHNERYRAGELARMVFAGPTTAITRPPEPAFLEDGTPAPYHNHKGFNWKALMPRVALRFEVERPTFSPLGWSRGLLSSQAWFVGRPKP